MPRLQQQLEALHERIRVLEETQLVVIYYLYKGAPRTTAWGRFVDWLMSRFKGGITKAFLIETYMRETGRDPEVPDPPV